MGLLRLLRFMYFWVATSTTIAPIFGAVPCSKPASACVTVGIGCLGAMVGKARLASKTHSCSELEEANRKLLLVKQEADKEDDLQRQIKDWVLLGGCVLYCPVAILLFYLGGNLFPHNEWNKLATRRTMKRSSKLWRRTYRVQPQVTMSLVNMSWLAISVSYVSTIVVWMFPGAHRPEEETQPATRMLSWIWEGIPSLWYGSCCFNILYWGSSKASPEELEASMEKPKKRQGKATAAKAVAQPRTRGTKKVQPSSPPKDATPSKPPPVKKVATEHDGDHTDVKPRRLAFKAPDPDKNRQMSCLQEDWLFFSKSGFLRKLSTAIPKEDRYSEWWF